MRHRDAFWSDLLLVADIWDNFGLQVAVGLKNVVKQDLFEESLNYLEWMEESLHIWELEK